MTESAEITLCTQPHSIQRDASVCPACLRSRFEAGGPVPPTPVDAMADVASDKVGLPYIGPHDWQDALRRNVDGYGVIVGARAVRKIVEELDRLQSPASPAARPQTPEQVGSLEHLVMREPDYVELKLALGTGHYMRLMADEGDIGEVRASWLMGARDAIENLVRKLIVERHPAAARPETAESETKALAFDAFWLGWRTRDESGGKSSAHIADAGWIIKRYLDAYKYGSRSPAAPEATEENKE